MRDSYLFPPFNDCWWRLSAGPESACVTIGAEPLVAPLGVAIDPNAPLVRQNARLLLLWHLRELLPFEGWKTKHTNSVVGHASGHEKVSVKFAH